jgi:hypothetical protein
MCLPACCWNFGPVRESNILACFAIVAASVLFLFLLLASLAFAFDLFMNTVSFYSASYWQQTGLRLRACFLINVCLFTFRTDTCDLAEKKVGKNVYLSPAVLFGREVCWAAAAMCHTVNSRHVSIVFLFSVYGQIQFLTGGVVFLTLIINGSTTQFLLSALRMNKTSDAKARHACSSLLLFPSSPVNPFHVRQGIWHVGLKNVLRFLAFASKVLNENGTLLVLLTVNRSAFWSTRGMRCTATL